MRPFLRLLGVADVPALLAVQAACYGSDLLEGRAVYEQRLSAAPPSSLGVFDAQGCLLAYLAACPSVEGAITPLHAPFVTPPQADTFYLHDLAVHPAQAGQGLAQRLLSAAWSLAHRLGLPQAALVSVQGSRGFWQRQGFSADPRCDSALVSYGPGAVYMRKLLLPDADGDQAPVFARPGAVYTD